MGTCPVKGREQTFSLSVPPLDQDLPSENMTITFTVPHMDCTNNRKSCSQDSHYLSKLRSESEMRWPQVDCNICPPLALFTLCHSPGP